MCQLVLVLHWTQQLLNIQVQWKVCLACLALLVDSESICTGSMLVQSIYLGLYSGSPLNGHPSTVDTIDITDNFNHPFYHFKLE